MKRIFKLAAIAAICAAALPSISSCGKIDNGQGSGSIEIVNGEPVELTEEAGTASIEFDAPVAWKVVKDGSTWLRVSPLNGAAGHGKVVLEYDANTELSYRNSNIVIIAGSSQTKYKVTQKCTEVFEVPTTEYGLTNQESLSVVVNSNIAFSVSTDASWITLPENPNFNGGVKATTVVFGIAKLEGSDERNGHITVTGNNGKSITINVSQNVAFYKRVLAYRFTGDRCPYCPYLAYAIEKYNEKQAGRMNVMCFYGQSFSTTAMVGNSCSSYESSFGITGFPTVVMDERGNGVGLSNANFLSLLTSFTTEMLESYPCVTGIDAKAEMSGDKVKISGNVYCIQPGTYHLHVAIMENGVKSAQSDATGLYTSTQLSNWTHNSVVRDHVTTKVNGQEIVFEAKGKKPFEFTADVPSKVKNKENISVAVYVTRPRVSGPKKASYMTYYNNRSEFVDNSVFVNLGESVELKYE